MAHQLEALRETSGAGVYSDVRDFWTVLKPNVMKLVVFTAACGLYLAPAGINPILAVVAILCIAAAAGASAAINNAYDADIDARMVRTRLRPTACGRILPADALALGIVLAVFSVMVMGLAVNWVAASLLVLTIAFYVFVYTMGLKRRTPQNIVIGGAAGAFPPMVGWAVATGDVSLYPILLFLIVFMWTPPHFWSLALYRTRDYAGVGVPMLPVVAGDATTRRHILAYTLALVPVALAPVALGYAGMLYGLAALALGGTFLWHAWQLHRSHSPRAANRTFRFSILYLFGLFTALVVDKALGLPGLIGAAG